jgi:type IV secretion system protein VirB2
MSKTCFQHGRVRARGPLAKRAYAATQQIGASAALTITAVITSCTPAGAAGSGMPWESPLTRILESIEGPVAKVCAVVIIIVTGLSLAFGDMSGGFRRLVQVVFGLSIAFAATSFFLSFFSFAGGALIE